MPRQAAENNKDLNRRSPRFRRLLLFLFAVLSISLVACDRGRGAEELDLQEARRLRGTQETIEIDRDDEEERPTLTLDPDRAIQPSQRRMIFRSIPQEYRTTTTPAPTPPQTEPTTLPQTTPSTGTPETTAPTTTPVPTTTEPTTTPPTTTTVTTTTEPTTTPEPVTEATTTEQTTTPEPTTEETTTEPTTEETTTEVHMITISFNPNGATAEIPDQVLEPGSYVEEPEAPVREGQTFLGWYFINEVGEQERFDFSITQWIDLELTAGWEPEQEETTTEEPTTEPTTEEPTTLPVTEEPTTQEPTTEEPTTEEPTTEEPTTEPTLATYRVTFVDGGELATLEGTPGDIVYLPTPTREGFEFQGWTDEAGTLVAQEFTIPEYDVILYAKWLEIQPIEEPVTPPAQGIPTSGNYVDTATPIITNIEQNFLGMPSFSTTDELSTTAVLQAVVRSAATEGITQLDIDSVNARIRSTLRLNKTISADQIQPDPTYTFDPETNILTLNPGALPDGVAPSLAVVDASSDGSSGSATVYQIGTTYINERLSALTLDNEIVGYRDSVFGSFYLPASLNGYSSYTYRFTADGLISSKQSVQGVGQGMPSINNAYANTVTLSSPQRAYVAPSNGNELRTEFPASTTLYVMPLNINGYNLVVTLDGSIAPSWIKAELIG